MKKTHWIVAAIVLLLILCISLSPRVSLTYEFYNPVEEIVSVELLENTNESGAAEEDKLLVRKTLTKDEIESFMSEVYDLETRRCYPPMWGWGEYIAKVTYSNGDIEMLGSGNIETIRYGETATGDGPYSFWEHGAFEEVFLRYLN